MKTRTKLLTIGLGAIAALNFASCQDYTEFTEQEIKNAEYSKKYDEEFIKRFGEPDANHTWGQDLGLKPIYAYGGNSTRTVNQNVNVNLNQWCDHQGGTGYNTGNQGLLIDKVQVPGWPNFDGYYYASKGEKVLRRDGGHEGIINYTTMMGDNSWRPVGDVTEYEIQYVSTWFRTHRYPVSIPLHLTDFFVQNISADKDQLYYLGHVNDYGKTRSDGSSLGTLSEPGYNGPNVDRVSDVLVDNNKTQKRTINNSEYHGEPVANIKRVTHDNNNDQINYALDYLHFGDTPNSFDNASLGDGNWTHVNDFNAGNTNYNPEASNDNSFRDIKYIYSSGTEDFACRGSFSANGPWIHNWVLVYLEWDEVGADGESHHRDGYYLGFDYEGGTNEVQVAPDGFYSNWIIKVSPGHFVPGEYSKRVMCEDLGGSFDFDFNDVVFDVQFDGSKNEAIISLKAAGGTLPIYVGDTQENHEAHYLLGHSSNQPVNVIKNGASHGAAIYRVSVTQEIKGGKQYINIPIKVKQNGQTMTTSVTKIQNVSTNYEWKPNDNPAQGLGSYEVSADKTPRNFVTEVGVHWMQELQGIDYGYDHFHKWVANENYQYEGVDGDGHSKTDLKWYNSPKASEKIYNYGIKEVVDPTQGDPTIEKVQWWQLSQREITEDFDLKGIGERILLIKGYSGDNSIVTELGKRGENGQLTFAYIFKHSGMETVKYSVMPVWKGDDGHLYYKFNDGRPDYQITNNTIKNATWRESYYQQDFKIEDTNTSIGKIALNINQLSVQNQDGTRNYCDYVILFVKDNLTITGEGTAENPVVINKNDSSPVSVAEMYCIW